VAGIVEQLIAPLTKTIGKKPAAKDPSAVAAGGASAPTGRKPILFALYNLIDLQI